MKHAALLLIALIALPVAEVALHLSTRAAVASLDDWQRAAARVRKDLRPKDLIVSAPSWTDPTLRLVLGDQVTTAMEGRSDTAAFERLWSLGIRGARPEEARGLSPELSERFGEVTVERFALGPSNVVQDLVDVIERAEVSVGARACPWKRGAAPRGGGLGYGVLPPIERFQCDGAGTWLAEVVMEDLDLQPRRCVYHPPGVGTPVRVVLHDVELSDELVLYGGLYSEHERMRQGPPVLASVSVNGQRLGTLTHRDGEGWKRLTLATSRGRADVAIEVVTSSRKQRGFCWAASIRSGGGR